MLKSVANNKNVVMSSADLLQRMRERNFARSNEQTAGDTNATSSAVSQAPAAVTSASDAADIEMMTEVRNFIAFGASVDGRAETRELLAEFSGRLPAHDSAKFKAMLKQLCTLHKDAGVGVWHLKPEFR